MARTAGSAGFGSEIARFVMTGVGTGFGILVAAGSPSRLRIRLLAMRPLRRRAGETGIGLRVVVSLLEIQDQRHQGFSNEATAEKAEVAALVWLGVYPQPLFEFAQASAATLGVSSAAQTMR